MLTIKCKKSYRTRSGSTGFIYLVSGEEKELAAYVAAKVAQKMPEDKIKDAKTGEVIFYANNYIGESCKLEISSKGNYYPETTDFDIMISNQRQIHANKTQVEVAA